MARLRVRVVEVRGYCAAGYKPGDTFVIDGFVVRGGVPVCIHALSAMMTLASPMLKGVPAEKLGIGEGRKGYVQCPDPGPPYTDGGSVVFELEVEEQDSQG